MIMAMPLKAHLQFRRYQRLQNENPLSSCKAVIFFHFVNDWDVPHIFACAMTSYSHKIYDKLPTTIFYKSDRVSPYLI